MPNGSAGPDGRHDAARRCCSGDAAGYWLGSSHSASWRRTRRSQLLIMARVLACAAPTQAGAASGLLNTVQQASGAVGVTCVGLAYEAGGLDGGLWLLGSSIVGTAVLLVGWRSTAR